MAATPPGTNSGDPNSQLTALGSYVANQNQGQNYGQGFGQSYGQMGLNHYGQGADHETLLT
jgi:hypothetical protein